MSAVSPDTEATRPGARRRSNAAIPERIDRYRVLFPLGAGGMGAVWAADDPELGRRVAIKVLHASRTGARSQARLLREAQAMAKLSHRNVVQIHDVGTTNDSVFIAMELIVGQTVSAWLRAETRGWAEIVGIFVQAGRGLGAAHAAGIVHRDFKPDNVLVGDDGRVCVADFGIASGVVGGVERRTVGATHDALSPLTSTGSVVGTPRYMAPEQYVGDAVGPAADQFSFCVALHEALFGEPPFGGATVDELAANTASGAYRKPADPRRAPSWILAAVRQGLVVDPAQRHASMEELVEALQRDPNARRRKHAVTAAVGVALVGSGSAAVWAATTAAPQRCTQGRLEMDALWTERRVGITKRVSELAAPGAGQTLDAVVEVVDRYADRWVDAHQQMCEAHQAGAASADLLDESMRCLDARKAGLGAVIGRLDGLATAEALEGAAVAGAKLPSVFACVDRNELARAPAPDESIAAEVESLTRALAVASVQHDAGEFSAASAVVAQLRERADQTGYAPLIAETALVAGRLAMERREWDAAQADLGVATARGIAAGVDAVAAESEARAIFVEAMRAEDPSGALKRESIASALAERAGSPPDLRALIANNVGVVYGMLGDSDRATSSFEHAVALAAAAQRIDPVNPIDRSGYLTNLAMHTADPTRRDQLFADADTAVGDAVGQSHYQRIDIVIRRATYLSDHELAYRALVPICDQLATRADDDSTRCFKCTYRLAQLQEFRGNAAEASHAAGQAAHCIESRYPSDPVPPDLAAFASKAKGYAALLSGEFSRAGDLLAATTAALQSHAEIPWVAAELAEVALLHLRVRAAQGAGPELRAPLERLIAQLEETAKRSLDQAPRDQARQAAALLERLGAMPVQQ